MIDLVKAAVDLRRWESSVAWMYRDKKGLVTVGIGNLLATVEAALLLPFQVANTAHEPATTAQIRAAYLSVRAMAPAMKANVYRNAKPTLFLAAFDINALLVRRLTTEFIPALERRFTYWSTFPEPAQRALLDMAFTLGPYRLFEPAPVGYPILVRACNEGRFDIASDECERDGEQEARHEWVRQMFLAAAATPVVN
jgi:GH24 family phage-related lysozyme (muramidase)